MMLATSTRHKREGEQRNWEERGAQKEEKLEMKRERKKEERHNKGELRSMNFSEKIFQKNYWN